MYERENFREVDIARKFITSYECGSHALTNTSYSSYNEYIRCD